MSCILQTLDFKQISIEPVVGEETDPYAIQKEDLPKIFEEYDKLARIIVERQREGKGFNFFHFMIDLEGGPCVAKTTVRLWVRNGISGSDSVGRFVSLSSVRRR